MTSTLEVKESSVRLSLAFLPFFSFTNLRLTMAKTRLLPRLSNLVSKCITPVSLRDLDAAGRCESAMCPEHFVSIECADPALDGARLFLLQSQLLDLAEREHRLQR